MIYREERRKRSEKNRRAEENEGIRWRERKMREIRLLTEGKLGRLH